MLLMENIINLMECMTKLMNECKIDSVLLCKVKRNQIVMHNAQIEQRFNLNALIPTKKLKID